MDKPAPKPKSIHQQLIADILRDYPGARTKGFMQALRSLPDGEYMADMHDNARQWWQSVSFIPDAYLIDTDKREVIIFEAVHHHDVDRGKFAKMAELSWGLDEDHFDLVLMRCDRFSRTRYLPQQASLAHYIQNPDRDQTADIVYVDDWHRYTAEHCAASLPIIPGIYSPAHIDRGEVA